MNLRSMTAVLTTLVLLLAACADDPDSSTADGPTDELAIATRTGSTTAQDSATEPTAAEATSPEPEETIPPADPLTGAAGPHPFTIDVEGSPVTGWLAGEAAPDGRAVVYYLYLHGAAFSAHTWVDNGILLAADTDTIMSYAIDLPSYGGTASSPVADDRFVSAVMTALELPAERTVVIAPSMSGRYLLPALTNGSLDRLAGVVGVAPIDAGPFRLAVEKPLPMPTLSIWGAEDGNDPEAAAVAFAGAFETARVAILADAGHDAYNQQPEKFVEVLHQFTESLAPCAESACFG